MKNRIVLWMLVTTVAFGQVAPAPIPSPAAPAPPGQTAAPSAQALSTQALMQASLEKQRASVRKQVSTAVAVPEAAARSWFTVPWEAPPQAAGAAEPPADCPEIAPAKLDELIEKNADGDKLPATLLREVIRQESAFQPCAVSSKGAQGLMQLMPETAAGFGVLDAFNPEENIAAGAKFLARLLERYKGDKKLALAAYNAGADRVTQYRGVPPFPETENYVKQILDRMDSAKPDPAK
jgi:soluble lytic murein transglycosylase-like protein